MIIKLLWTTLMFLSIVGGLFFAAIGIDIPVAYYEKNEILIADEDD